MIACRRKIRTFVAALAVSGALIGGCDSKPATPSPDTTIAMEDPALNQTPAACPDHLYTDQQRLAVAATGTYAGGVLCAVPDAKVGSINPSHYQKDTVLIAWVIAADTDAGYASEGFGAGRTCIYAGRVDPVGPINDPTDLQGFVKTIPQGATACPPFNATGTTRMQVHDGGTAGPPGQIPPVARIDQDADRHILIGVPCLQGRWCEITKDGAATTLSPLGNYRRDIKGWYDEQPLAIKVGMGLAPSAMIARIYPSDDLEAASTDTAGFNDWVTVAVIKFKPWPSTDTTWKVYAGKWGFDTATISIASTDSILVQLQYVTRGIKNDYKARFVKNSVTNGVIGNVRKVKYKEDHPLAPGVIPIKVAAVRWGWLPEDEAAWTRCTAGCCEIGTEDFPLVTTTGS